MVKVSFHATNLAKVVERQSPPSACELRDLASASEASRWRRACARSPADPPPLLPRPLRATISSIGVTQSRAPWRVPARSSLLRFGMVAEVVNQGTGLDQRPSAQTRPRDGAPVGSQRTVEHCTAQPQDAPAAFRNLPERRHSCEGPLRQQPGSSSHQWSAASMLSSSASSRSNAGRPPCRWSHHCGEAAGSPRGRGNIASAGPAPRASHLRHSTALLHRREPSRACGSAAVHSPPLDEHQRLVDEVRQRFDRFEFVGPTRDCASPRRASIRRRTPTVGGTPPLAAFELLVLQSTRRAASDAGGSAGCQPPAGGTGRRAARRSRSTGSTLDARGGQLDRERQAVQPVGRCAPPRTSSLGDARASRAAS